MDTQTLQLRHSALPTKRKKEGRQSMHSIPSVQPRVFLRDLPLSILSLCFCTSLAWARVKLSHTKLCIAIPKGPGALSSLTSIMQGKPSKSACPESKKAVLWKHGLVSWQRNGQHPPRLPPWPAGCVSKTEGQRTSHIQNQSYFREELSLHVLWMMNDCNPKGHIYRDNHGLQRKKTWFSSVCIWI